MHSCEHALNLSSFAQARDFSHGSLTAYMGIGTRAHRIIAIIQISIVTIRIMHAISILYSSLCSLNAAMRTIALTSAIIAIPFHSHENSCINCIGSLPFWNLGSPPRVWGKDLKISEKHCIILKYTVVRIRHLHL